MKRILLLLGVCVLASITAFAQDAAGNNANPNSQDQNTQTRTTRTNVIRGCLSGSTGNYTVTDPNGMQYQVNGDDNTLRSMVGREVEITLSEDRSSEDSTQASGTTTHSSNAVQSSYGRAVASTCRHAGSSANPSGASGTQDERPAPQMMSMLQQQSAPGQDNQTQNGSAPQPPVMPPVTSQTPATSTSPTAGSNSQAGTSPANSAGMTGSEANHDAQAARQGELNTDPQAGQTTGNGVNDQGMNNPASVNPNATSPNSATASPQTQPNCAQNHPVYECQATNIPWANTSGGNTGTPPH